MRNKPVISILGCGWYGLALGKALVNAGYTVKGSTTTDEKVQVLKDAGINPFLVNFVHGNESFEPAFFDCDVLWIAIPPRSKHSEGAFYSDKIERIANNAALHGVKQVIHISSTGVYGEHNCEVDELTPPMPISASGKALLETEDLLRKHIGFTSTIIRFGGLFGPGRLPGRFFAGKRNIPNGKAPINLIHLDDCLGISQAILTKEAFGHTFNACAPQHPTKATFYTRAANAAGLEKPEFIDVLLEWKIVNSVYVKPVLQYIFKHNL